MNRRQFLSLSATAAAATPLLTSQTHAAEGASGAREYYELRHYTLTTEAQRKTFDEFLAQIALPAAHRLGVKPLGVFYPKEGFSPVTLLLPHPSLESVATFSERLVKDHEFVTKGAAFLGATRENPAFKRYESSLLRAFSGMPKLEIPVKGAARVMQLRVYESPSVKAAQKKIEMFNDGGEIRIFREVGLNPVFFGETIIGPKMPSLTYLLAFESQDHLKSAWKKFSAHPDWQKLRTVPEYADKSILTEITNSVLTPAPYSEI